MTAQTFTQGTMFGFGAALTTNTGLIANVVSFDDAMEISREAIETTVSSASNDGTRTYIPGDLRDFGSITLTVQYSSQLDYGALFGLASGAPAVTPAWTGCDTITITFPKRATTCGGSIATTAATWAAPVVITKIKAQLPNDKQITAAITFKIAGKPTYIAAA